MRICTRLNFALLRGFILPAALLTAVICAAQAPGKVLADVPMLFRGASPVVEVMVNSKGPFLFLVDTGAAGVGRIDASREDELKLPQVGEARASDGSGQNIHTIPIYRAETLQVGSYEMTSVDLASRSYNRPGEMQIDGVLGFGFFANSLLVLDFPNKRVQIIEGSLPPTDN